MKIKEEPGNDEIKIWIDFDNSPHVPFFYPIVKELKESKYKTVLTIRDCFQVKELADYYQIDYTKIGKHYGKNKILKVLGTLFRSLQLLPYIVKEKPKLSVSHGSRSLIFLSALLRIPTVLIFDYEHSEMLPFIKPHLGIAPESISSVKTLKKFRHGIKKYPGLKEDVYVYLFKPDETELEKVGLTKNDFFVTIRPPATEAHYHNPESEKLFSAVVDFLGKNHELRMVILPRNEITQRRMIEKTWPDLVNSGRIIIPTQVINGLDLIWYSDFVVSGGGTMNREAAALGVPVYSIFRGRLGDVDRYLAESGRLRLLENISDIESKLVVVRRKKSKAFNTGNSNALDSIVENIVQILKGL